MMFSFFKRPGFTLLEVMLAVVMLAIAGLATVALMQKVAIQAQKIRERQNCEQMAQTGFARLKKMDFYRIFPIDSSLAGWANPPLHTTGAEPYPYFAVLNGMKTTLGNYSYPRFTVGVVYMRRDTTNALALSPPMMSALIPFTPGGGGSSLVDLYDSNIKFNDIDSDGDYYEINGGVEQPDTHMKQVTLTLYNMKNQVACYHTELVSLEQFSGSINQDAEAALSLLISTPYANAFLYKANTVALQNSRNLSLFKVYPSTVTQIQYRADGGSLLTVSGLTEPLATVTVYLDWLGPQRDNQNADTVGNFAVTASNVTNNMNEGAVTITAKSVKNPYTSPIASIHLIYDIQPPVVSTFVPTVQFATRVGCIKAIIADIGIATTTTSGIDAGMIAVKIDGSTAPFSYFPVTPASGTVVWIDSTTAAPIFNNDISSTVTVEFADFAGYKSSFTWTISNHIPNADGSFPVFSSLNPPNGSLAASDSVTISAVITDPDTGVDPSALILKLDGVTVVDRGTLNNIATSYDPCSGTISYPTTVTTGVHTITLTASNFAKSGAGSGPTVQNWSFIAP